jgi:5-methylcytosine-specific restriction enzyme A
VLKRDEYRCQECKRYGKNTEATTVHHVHPLLERPDLRLVSWNLITLCGVCHGKMHDRITDQLTQLGSWWKEKVTPPPSE